MKKFTQILMLMSAFVFVLGTLQAQNKVMTKAQSLGLEVNTDIQTQKLMKATSTRGTTLLDEGFDIEGDFPPAGWSVINFHSEENWLQTNPEDDPFSDIDPTSLFSAMAPWIAEDQDEWLISPVIDAAGETPIQLTWYAGVSGPYLDPGATLICLISTDGGTTWTELWNAIDEIDPSASWAWNMVEMSLDSYADSPFQLAWQYVGNDGDLAGVDGVMVQSGGTTLYESGFEDYTVGEMVALDDETGFWTTWSDEPGGDEDAFIVDNESASPSNSAKVEGLTDLLFLMGDKRTGKYQFNFKIFVPSDYGGYFNIQHYEEAGKEYAYDVFFGAGVGADNGYVEAADPDAIPFTYTHDSWVQIENIFDLNNDLVELWIEGTLVLDGQFSNSTLQLGAADIWAGAPDIDVPQYYIDDVEFIEIVPALQEPIMVVTSDNPIFVSTEQWEETVRTFSIANQGQADLEYEVVVGYSDGVTKAPVQEISNSTTSEKSYSKNKNIASTVTSSATNNPSKLETVLNYDGDNDNAIGQSVDYEYVVAALFPSDMIQPYIGMTITKVDIFVNDPAQDAKIQIFGMGSFLTGEPGELLYEQAFDAVAGEWNSITLDEPFVLDGQDVSVGWQLFGLGGTFVPGVDAGPADPNGRWLKANEGSWSRLSLDYNWNIRAYLEGETITQWMSVNPSEGTLAKDESADIDVTIVTNDLDPVAYYGQLYVRGNDPNNESETIDVVVDVAVGLNEFGEHEYIMVYPNPAKDMLRISSNGDLQQIHIMNALGQVVFNEVMNSAKTQINIGHLETGIYFVQIETKVGTTTQKIIIE